jgi:hypothetical protein
MRGRRRRIDALLAESQVRGTAQAGQVVKDYEVRRPRTAAVEPEAGDA